jgi:PE family
MSYVIAAPEMMAAAATDLAGIGSTLSEAHIAAALPTVGLVPTAADEVSVGIAHLFSQHAQGYQALAGQAAVFHEQFVQHLTAGAHSYAATEAANAASLQHLNASARSSAGAIAALAVPSLNTLLNNAITLLGNIIANPLIFIEALIVVLVLATAPISIPLILLSILVLGELGQLLGQLGL